MVPRFAILPPHTHKNYTYFFTFFLLFESKKNKNVHPFFFVIGFFFFLTKKNAAPFWLFSQFLNLNNGYCTPRPILNHNPLPTVFKLAPTPYPLEHFNKINFHTWVNLAGQLKVGRHLSYKY